MSTRKPMKQQLAELDARRQSLAARIRKEERTKDMRRKILLGALILKRLTEEGEFAERLLVWLRKNLPNYLKRKSDLALFDDLLKVDALDIENVDDAGNENGN